MEDNKCPVFVDGKECGLPAMPLTRVDLEVEKIARYDLGTYQCSLGHRSYVLLEPDGQEDQPAKTESRSGHSR